MSDRPGLDVGAVFEQHQRLIESVARRYAHNANDVPDIVQDVGVRLCQSLQTFRGEAKLQSWLYRVTHNATVSFYRRQRRHVLAVQAITDQQQHEGEPFEEPDDESWQRHDALHDAIGRLKSHHREAIVNVLRPDVVLSGRSRVLMRQRQFHARRRLKALLQNDPRVNS